MLIHRELRTFQLHRLLLCYVQHAWVVDEIGHNFCCVFTVYTRSIDHHWLGGLIVVGYTLHVIASRLDAWSKHCASFLCMQCLPVTSLHFGINSTIFQCFGCIFSISQKVTYIMYCPKCLIFPNSRQSDFSKNTYYSKSVYLEAVCMDRVCSEI